MRCREVVELMTDYLEGELSPNEVQRFEEHIAGCDGCRGYLEQMRATRRLTGAVAAEPIPDGLRDELLAAFRTWRSTERL